LREEPGERISFAYDENYLDSGQPEIAYTLPLRKEPFISAHGLLAFFDNLVAEGWLENAQSRLLGKRAVSRFELLLAFGSDCAGAVSVLDPEPNKLSGKFMDTDNPKELAVMNGRASLSGVQPKLAIVERGGVFFPAKIGELSTHIAKFPSSHHEDLVINEYLTTLAFKTLMPKEEVVDLHMKAIHGFEEQALIIKRFDRAENGERIHFEEFNQLLGNNSLQKYDGNYKQMADFIRNLKEENRLDLYKLFKRIIAGFLLGNTDMHLKNFAMIYREKFMQLVPVYDEVCSTLYGYKTLALSLGGAKDMELGSLKPKHIIALGQEFDVPDEAIKMAVDQLKENLEAAKTAIASARVEAPFLKNTLIETIEKRWNGTFALIGKSLSKRP